LRQLPGIETSLVIGKYAHEYHFGKNNLTVTKLVENWQQYWPGQIPLPHPSPRNNIWLKKNPWFEAEVVPVMRAHITSLLKT